MAGFSKHFILAAGGTGGHMMPAYALAQELIYRGHRVALITDERGQQYPGMVDKGEVHVLPAGRFSKKPGELISGVRALWAGRKMAMQLYRSFQPTAVVGFGGYPSLPALLAAFSANIPTVVHEQNAVLGRVNRFTASRVSTIATSYPDVQRIKPKHQGKVHLVGNPVREEVIALREEPYPPLFEDGILRVLVTGGSQGARILGEVVPDAMALLPTHLRRRLQVTQQAREEDIEGVRAKYAEHDIPAELATYLDDLPQRLGWSHLVIGRAGASTVAELTVAGRPAILVPLPIATDDHQTHNVKEMVAAGGARSIQQPAFTPKELAKQMQKLALQPGALENAAMKARKCGRPEAVRDLADLVESFGAAPLGDTMKAKPEKKPLVAGPKPALAKESVE